jgi:integrase
LLPYPQYRPFSPVFQGLFWPITGGGPPSARHQKGTLFLKKIPVSADNFQGRPSLKIFNSKEHLTMKHGAYCLYKKKTAAGLVWYVRFWDEIKRKYSVVRSTGIRVRGKKGRRRSADDVARDLLDKICFNPSEQTIPQYLDNFWKENSMYARECRLIRKTALSLSYIRMNASLVKHHLREYPGFQRKYLQDLRAGMIRDWMLWEAERGVSSIRINKALQAFRIALHYALTRDEIRHDPFANVLPAAAESAEKGVLTRQEVKKLIEYTPADKYPHLMVLFGLLCGMRLGEVRGVQWEDIRGDELIIRHNWQDLEGLKEPKCGSGRTVPLPRVLKDALGEGGKGFIFPSEVNGGSPVSGGHVRNRFIKELQAIGIPEKEQRLRRLSFHSLRHTFVTLGRMAGISDMAIRALAGHKSPIMMDRYSHAAQVIDLAEAREQMERAIGT